MPVVAEGEEQRRNRPPRWLVFCLSALLAAALLLGVVILIVFIAMKLDLVSVSFHRS